jgi:hypothetical protein
MQMIEINAQQIDRTSPTGFSVPDLKKGISILTQTGAVFKE